jgi:hypothetical protein
MKSLLMLFVLSSIAYAQSAKISGTIYEKHSNKRVIGGNVILKDSSKGAAADLDGKYFISKIEPGTHVLECTFPGYFPQTDTITIKADESLIVNFMLKKDPNFDESKTKIKQPNPDHKFELLEGKND